MSKVWKPHTTVAAVIERDGRYLIVEELIRGQYLYNQPAGHLDPNESIIDAAIRETKEETAWDFKPEYISGIYCWDQTETGRCFLRFSFVGSCDNHDAEQALDDGIVRAIWLSREELAADQEKLRSPMVLTCIDDYIAGKKYPLELLTDMN